MTVTTFGTKLSVLLAARRMSQAEFARAAGVTKGWPSNIQSGRQRPPKDEKTLEEWARILGLNVTEMDEFVELALLEHTPKRIRERFAEMKASLASRGSKRRRA